MTVGLISINGETAIVIVKDENGCFTARKLKLVGKGIYEDKDNIRFLISENLVSEIKR